MKARNRQIALEIRDDVPSKFLEMYDDAGRGKGRSLLLELITVGVALKDMDSRLFRMIQASAEGGSLNINDLSVYVDACRKLENENKGYIESNNRNSGSSEGKSSSDHHKKAKATDGFQSMIS